MCNCYTYDEGTWKSCRSNIAFRAATPCSNSLMLESIYIQQFGDARVAYGVCMDATISQRWSGAGLFLLV